MKFLRGYQTTDASGTAAFTTIYPTSPYSSDTGPARSGGACQTSTTRSRG